MKQWFVLAVQPKVVKRALKFAVVVGAVLITINHGDAIVQGDLNSVRIVKIGLTVMVPYIVSTLSSVGAMMEMQSKTT